LSRRVLSAGGAGTFGCIDFGELLLDVPADDVIGGPVQV